MTPAPTMVTIDEAVAYCGLRPEDVDRRALVERLRAAAEEAFLDASGREFIGPGVVENRLVVIDGRRRVPIPDLGDPTGAVVELHRADGTLMETLTAATDYHFAPRYRRPGRPYTAIVLSESAGGSVAGDYLDIECDGWGWAAVPERARQHVLEQVRLWYDRDVTRVSSTMLVESGRIEVPRALASSVEFAARSYKRRTVGGADS